MNEAGEAGEVVMKKTHLPDQDLRLEEIQCDHMMKPKSIKVIQCDAVEANEAGEAGEAVKKKTHQSDLIQCDQFCRLKANTSPAIIKQEHDIHPRPNPNYHSHTCTAIGENGLLQRDNTVPSTALRGGKGIGPPQGSSDQHKEYQDTNHTPTATTKINTTTRSNTATATTTHNTHHQKKKTDKNSSWTSINLNKNETCRVKRKWSELQLRDKKFTCLIVVDYGVVRSTRKKKRKV